MPSNVTNGPPQTDRRVLRAARSLYINRRNKKIVEGRIDRATGAILAFLGLYGLDSARLGLYDVALDNGEIHLTKCPSSDATQLVLPELEDAE